MPHNLIIAVPLMHEHRVLQRYLRKATAQTPTMICCGPGARGVRRLAEHPIGANQSPTVSSRTTPLVILAGLAGALTRRCAVGSAHWIGRVVDEAGESYVPDFIPPEYAATNHLLPTVTAATDTCAEPVAKRALAEHAGADLVDLESLHFARQAQQCGWSWAIVRGVSDGPDDALPAGIDSWVDEAGRTRMATIARAIAHRPHLIGNLRHLHRFSVDALRSVAERLCALWW